MNDTPLDLAAVRQHLQGRRGPEFWRSLEELAQRPDFLDLMHRELPRETEALGEPLDRRRFLTLLGASLALAGLNGCSVSQAPQERIMPYVRQPEQVVPGQPLYYATAMPLAGYASGGLVVESHLGRPTKVEGNPDHPSSPKPAVSPRHARFGPTDLYAQASILSLYDPDRAHTVTNRGVPSTWEAFQYELSAYLRRHPKLRILTGTVTSPTLAHLMRLVLRRFPEARWHQWEPAGNWHELEGARLAFGRYVETHYRLELAERILSLDADFLSCRPGHVRYVRDFSDRRRVWSSADQQHPAMNRLYVVESCLSNTGAKADHRLALRPAQIEAFARAIAEELGISARQPNRDAAFGLPAGWIAALVEDLRQHRGRSIVLAGAEQPPIVHALAHAMNDRLGNVGRTVIHTQPIAVPMHEGRLGYDQAHSVWELAEDMDAGRVDALLVIGGNPVYSAPADLRFEERLQKVPLRAALSSHFDETAAHCHWHVPEAHYLESWGDVRAHDGTVTILQPLIAPLYQGRSPLELLSWLAEQSEQTALEIVQAHWRRQQPGGNFDAWWQRCLNRGYIEGTEAARERNLEIRADFTRPAATEGARDGLDIVFRPDPSLFDGRFANNGWLQELPRPFSKLTWDNVATISPQTAVDLELAPTVPLADEANGKEVELTYGERKITAPVWVQPGHADRCVSLTLGYGRRRAGRVGSDIGYNANLLRTTAAPWFDSGVQARATGRRVALAPTHGHHLMHNRDLVRAGEVEKYSEVVASAKPQAANGRITLYPPRDYSQGNKWGMAIDLNACTGCQACVLACQAENNIPVVGKEQVERGREMHWLRIDVYYKGAPEKPSELETYFEPVPCMHCENAPCEYVCPVEATVHSADGLNDMVYNRCVGTRYCSNNCPYKVRRFNFLQYSDFTTENWRLMRNPDVTVRSRGVMEKCTYCVQRLRQGQIRAELADREVRDGEVQTACQSACPAGAIVFGDLNDHGAGKSQVARMQEHALNYTLLDELNTRPRTTYLWTFKNPNPAITRLQRG